MCVVHPFLLARIKFIRYGVTIVAMVDRNINEKILFCFVSLEYFLLVGGFLFGFKY